MGECWRNLNVVFDGKERVGWEGTGLTEDC